MSPWLHLAVPAEVRRAVGLVALVAATAVLAGAGCTANDDLESVAQVARMPVEPTVVATTAPVVLPPTATPTPTVTPVPTPTYAGWVHPDTVGENVGEFPGLLTFRGNPTRTFYGSGPVPRAPHISWRFGGGEQLCSWSSVGGETTKWCGTGWTGQPAVFDYDGVRWVIVGSFAPAVHFLDASSGERIMPDFVVGDLIKGSVTVDPDGYPLVYFGSRDGYFRIVAFDGPEPREVWRLSADAVSPTMWNDDWDGVSAIVDDFLFVGGENSNIHIVALNRSLDSQGRVKVDPELVFHAPGWDQELLGAVGDGNVSIETSVTIFDDWLWFANSGGLVQAWDIGGLRDGVEPTRAFRYWVGDDTDASLVIDDEGLVYVAAELERGLSRALELGQLVKLDPTKPDDPVVWSRDFHVRIPDGIWATPALHRDVLYVPTNEGLFYAIDRETGETRWQTSLAGPVWSSPVVVDDVLVQADCAGAMRAWDVADTTRDPELLWTLEFPWCVESTPAVWGGQIIVGHRRGEIVAIED